MARRKKGESEQDYRLRVYREKCEERVKKTYYRISDAATEHLHIRLNAADLDTIRTLARDYGYRSLTSYVIDACKKWGGPR